MTRLRRALVVALAAAGVALAARAADRQAFDQIERGRYLARLGDCVACHTTPGGKPYAGGLAIDTPFGTLLGPNITPDVATGIGAWTDDEFVAAVQRGIGPGGEHLYPAMPYPYYTKAKRDDILAIRAFLATLEPVSNEVHSNQLPFPFNVRASLMGWNTLYFKPGELAPVADKSAEWNRGAYLVESLGHCGACHTPKTTLGGDETSHALQGGVLQGWFSPDLAGDPRTGLAGWTIDDIVEYLRTGHNRFAAATGPMGEVVTDSTSYMNESDLRAIATYLKDLPARGASAPTPVAESDPAMRAGQAIYVDNCSACHARDGSGVARMFPSLRGAPAIQSDDPTSLIRVVLQGARSVSTQPAPTGPGMPALGWKLSDAQVAAVVTYIRNAWGNAASAVSADTVTHMRDQLAKRPD